MTDLSPPEIFAAEIAKGYVAPDILPDGTGTLTGGELAQEILLRASKGLKQIISSDFLAAVDNGVPEENAKRGVAQRLLESATSHAVMASRILDVSSMEEQAVINPFDVLCLGVYFDFAKNLSMQAEKIEDGFPAVEAVIERASQRMREYASARLS